jgi:hypothetical protein
MKSVAPLPISRGRYGSDHSRATDTFRCDYWVFLAPTKAVEIKHSGIRPSFPSVVALHVNNGSSEVYNAICFTLHR